MATLLTAKSERVIGHLNPTTLARNLWLHRDLIRRFTWREIQGRYKGSFLGIFWSLVNPLVLLLIYTFVFGIVLQARWPQAKVDNLSEFALVIFCGLTAFNIFGECMIRAPTIITSVPNYVTKVIFPLEILPVSVLGAALFHALVSFSILLVVKLIITGIIWWTIVLLPVVALPLIFLSMGFSWFLASLGVFIRDTHYSIGLVLQVLFFMTAIFYPVEAVPEPFQTIIHLNPLTTIIESFRQIVLWGTMPDWPRLGIWLFVTGALMLLGYAWFMKTKKGFADVI
jgi:lipopolysaccharide transport system permease protein